MTKSRIRNNDHDVDDHGHDELNIVSDNYTSRNKQVATMMTNTSLKHPPTSNGSCNGNSSTITTMRPTTRQTRRKRDSTHHQHHQSSSSAATKIKMSSFTLFLIVLVMFVMIEITIFYNTSSSSSSSLSLFDKDTLSYSNPNKNNGSGRIVNVYDNEHPLITIEERSKANTYPPLLPLMLESPYVRILKGEEEKEEDGNDANDGTTKVFSYRQHPTNGGTIIHYKILNVQKEIEKQKLTHPAYLNEDTTQAKTLQILKSMGVDDPNNPTAKEDEDDDGTDDGENDDDEESTDAPPNNNKKKNEKNQIKSNYIKDPLPETVPPTNWTKELPTWEQVLDNYGVEPVILGTKSRCEVYRDNVPPELRSIAPAGMFSTGTNLLYALLLFNCIPPDINATIIEDRIQHRKNKTKDNKRQHEILSERQQKQIIRRRKKFVLWQAPWGKHNPEGARLHFAPEKFGHHNQSNIFPTVMIRHPLTWIQTMCKHSYSANWNHNQKLCGQTVNLEQPLRIRYGSSGIDNITKRAIRTKYDGLVQLYKSWYDPYIRNTNYPMAIARFEDLVYRPKIVVQQICECVGGTVLKEFSYRVETTNVGPGHGAHSNSDLISSFAKYGKPLQEYYQNMLSKRDKDVLKQVFNNDNDRNMLDVMGYKMFH